MTNGMTSCVFGRLEFADESLALVIQEWLNQRTWAPAPRVLSARVVGKKVIAEIEWPCKEKP